ncbi:2-oxoglutarate oxidoreductase gamma subunit [Desulfocucumis palustris]|uniref:2-oxoglutarate oxidoreductase gamma subunit n=1 Tax=Desulfocucumis palustris TaxID=1898651 RepID=A0A2L2XB68_9FIRM|nr:2-oxoacid:acceptor oxidoreductase family protein [Desulfocucumis palustris]GBF33312.1 2-oxoglutarate oxidoreductase gamma subunit [Desulfocucumis palustris]
MGKRIEVLISGFGGQGVVRLGQILAQVSVDENLYTTMLVSHGTETRGGYVRTQVVISDAPVDSPVCEDPDFLVAMSKAAYNKFKPLVSQGVIIYEPYYVEQDHGLHCRQISVNAREMAINELGREIYANVVVLGYLTRLLDGTLSKDQVLKVMLQKIPKFHEENKKAFELGYSLAVS